MAEGGQRTSPLPAWGEGATDIAPGGWCVHRVLVHSLWAFTLHAVCGRPPIAFPPRQWRGHHRPSHAMAWPDHHSPSRALQSFFQWSQQAGQAPASASQEGLRVVLTPRSWAHQTPGPAAGGPASAARSAPRTGRSRLSQAAPALAAAAAAIPTTEVAEVWAVEATQLVVVPPELVSRAGGAAAAADLGGRTPATTAAGRTPAAAPPAEAVSTRKSAHRSSSRTPGTKVLIIERSAQTTPRPPVSAQKSAAAARVAAAAVQTTPRPPASLQWSARQGVALAPAAAQTTPQVLSTIGMQTEGSEESGEEGVEQALQAQEEGEAGAEGG